MQLVSTDECIEMRILQAYRDHKLKWTRVHLIFSGSVSGLRTYTNSNTIDELQLHNLNK